MYPYIFLTLSLLTNIVGQVILKLGANQIHLAHGFWTKVLNPYIIGGLTLYVFGAFFWIIALTKLDLSLAYPIISLSYIGIALISFYIFHEPITLPKIAGIVIITLGVFILNQ